jgi:anti-sigma factor RsiW
MKIDREEKVAEPTNPCEEVRDLLHMLIENELEDDDARFVLGHLSECRACREALAQHVKLHGLLTTNMPWLSKIHFGPVRRFTC